MNLRGIFALSTLSVMIRGALWAAAVQPVILSLGAVLSAIDLDILDVQPLNWFPFIIKEEKTTTDSQEAQKANEAKETKETK